MGQNPYLNCGPVWSENAVNNANPNYRAGSILNKPGCGPMLYEDKPAQIRPLPEPECVEEFAGGEPIPRGESMAHKSTGGRHSEVKSLPSPPERQAAHDEPAEDTASADDVAPAPPDAKEGATRVLSVTDRKVSR